MRYLIADGRVMVRSHTQEPGSWQLFNWTTCGWEAAEFLGVETSQHWKQITAAEALLIAAGAQMDDRLVRA